VERPLRGAEIGEVEGRVRVDDADHGHVRHVEALRDHLRADDDVRLSAPQPAERLAVVLARPHAVAVHAGDGELRQALPDFLLDLFGADAEVPELAYAAVRADIRQWLGRSARVALLDVL